MKKGLFYNNLYGMAIEGLIEFLIISYLNIKTLEASSNGEIMGAVFSCFCIFLSSMILPCTLIFMAYSKNS